MKYLIISDIHGSFHYIQALEKILAIEQPDKIICLGDFYYHGPRNPLPVNYDPLKVSEFFNSIQDKLVAIKGNCDAEVDEMISNFTFKTTHTFNITGKKIFCSHGHKYNIDNLPKTDFDIMFYGHFHTGLIECKNGKVFANPGSLSLPKNNQLNSYIILTPTAINLKDLNQNIIQSLSL